MLDFLVGALVATSFMSNSSKTISAYEKSQIDKVLEIANTINFLGRTLPADTDITASVIELKAQFDQIDGSAITDPMGLANYNAIKEFFDLHLG